MAGRKTLPSLAYFRHTSNFNPFNDPAMGEEEGGGGLTKKKKKTHQKAINLGAFRFVRFISKINHFPPMQIQQKRK
jgi:hypothetical protein